MPLLEIGADSLVLVELIKKIEQNFSIKLSIRQLFEDFLTIKDLSRFINTQRATSGEVSQGDDRVAKETESTAKPSSHKQDMTIASHDDEDLLDITQSAYLQSFISAYISKTKLSKETSQKYNNVLCNSRKSFAVIKDQIKELFYTIHTEKSRGSTFIDLDGNEYIDIAMGFGVHFFGHSPDFLVKDLEDQLKLGLQLGPEHPKVGVAASYINELTGCDRVVFCNTGTEAIMTALRIVRAYTGKDKVAIFKNSYHGHIDSTLAVPDIKQPGYRALPMAKGTPQSLVDDTIVLDYDDPSAISYVQQYGHQLAAVLVEPVQNRRPDLHPKNFLLELRKATQDQNIPLIFDEILTGFRIAQGGAQEYFGVRADMVAYGKVIGGGLPVSVVAGKKELMSYVDGGVLGDQPTETTYTAGTFIKNPLSIVAMNSVLSEIKKKGKKVYEDLNKNTEDFVVRMNALFASYSVPFRVDNFGSFFRFSQSGNLSFVYRPIELDLFYYHMIYNGVYLWEGATCFLSTSHSNEDIEKIIEAADKSIKSLLEGGFFKNLNKYHQIEAA